MKGWFVTGTDTGVGKTQIAAALLLRLNAAGQRALGMKPVASGCRETPAGLVSEDAELLREAGAERVPLADLNPYAFAPAIAPHLAARESKEVIALERIMAQARTLQARASLLVVEGVGGWCVPLADETTVKDLALCLRLPVILVVGMRLGCLNHALLTQESIVHAGLPLAGWVANQIDPAMARFEQNVASLRQRIAAPCIGIVPFMPAPSPAAIAPHLDPSVLVFAHA